MAQPPSGIPILEPWETAMMEHQDRRDRMRRLSQRFGDVLIRYEEYLVQKAQDDKAMAEGRKAYRHEAAATDKQPEYEK